MRFRALAAGCAVILAGGLTGTFLWLHNDHRHTVIAKQVTSAAHREPMPSANVRFLEEALDNSSRLDQAKALVPELRGLYLQQHSSMLPSRTTVTIKASTFVADNSTSRGNEYSLHLYRQDGIWLIVYTEEK
jgi:hypothetical protein